MLLIGLTVSQCAAELPSHASAREALTSVRLLNDTWNLESNAVLRSEAFADHADQEGYAPIASLFRAAAASQRVHARSLSVAVKRLGQQPEVVLDRFVVTSTSENLLAEIALHARYKEETLPAMVLALKQEHFVAATRSMADARRSESSLIDYFKETAEHLGTSRKAVKATYYVCKQCGYMTRSTNFHVCKVCHHFREKHEAVS